MLFQNKLDKSLEKLHESKMEKDGHMTEVEVEAEKEKLEWRDYLAMTVSALFVILPVALIVLVILAVIGVLFLLR